MDYNFCNGTIWWHISKSIKVVSHFLLVFTINEKVAFEIFDGGQRDVRRQRQNTQWSADIKGLRLGPMKIRKMMNLDWEVFNQFAPFEVKLEGIEMRIKTLPSYRKRHQGYDWIFFLNFSQLWNFLLKRKTFLKKILFPSPTTRDCTENKKKIPFLA